MKNSKKSLKKLVLTLFFLIFLVILIYSSINIIKWYIDSKKTKNEINDILTTTEVKENIDNDNTVIVSNDASISDPYWDYINVNLIDVNFKDLIKKNDETIGWIKVNGTNVNYPFVQTSDNDFYLSHTFDKSYNNAGWVFMDYRNNPKDFDKNTIIYAHGRLDKTMFGSLRKIITNEWFNNQENHIIKLSTPFENTLWQVFSVYKIPTTNDYIKITFNSNEEYTNFLNMLINRSIFNFNTTINYNDKILTLSTCYDDYNKVVLHAKLIKYEKKS